MIQYVKKDESTAVRRRVILYLQDASGNPVTTKAGEQPQISFATATFADTTGPLVHIGNGNYYVQLATTEVDTAGMFIVRFDDADTVESRSEGYVVEYDPYDMPATIFGTDLFDYQVVGTFGRIIQEFSQHSFMSRTLHKATAAVPAQNILSAMAEAGCIQYETVKISETRDFASPDFAFYILYHYDSSGDVDEVRASTTTTWS